MLLELDFVGAEERQDVRTRSVTIPCLPAGSKDILHLDAALWNMTRSESDLRRRIKEQEQILFSDKLDFVFLGESLLLLLLIS